MILLSRFLHKPLYSAMVVAVVCSSRTIKPRAAFFSKYLHPDGGAQLSTGTVYYYYIIVTSSGYFWYKTPQPNFKQVVTEPPSSRAVPVLVIARSAVLQKCRTSLKPLPNCSKKLFIELAIQPRCQKVATRKHANTQTRSEGPHLGSVGPSKFGHRKNSPQGTEDEVIHLR